MVACCEPVQVEKKGWYNRHLIVQRNISVALHQTSEYIILNRRLWRFQCQDDGTGLLSPKHGSAVGSDPCDAGSSPSKGPIYERSHRHERIQIQIEGGGPAGRVRDAEIRTPQFRDSQDGNPGRVPRDRREERLAGKGNLRKDEVSRRRGVGRGRCRLRSREQGRLRLRARGYRRGADQEGRRKRRTEPTD